MRKTTVFDLEPCMRMYHRHTAQLTAIAALDDACERLLHLLAQRQDEVQHLAAVATDIIAKRHQLRLVVANAVVCGAVKASCRL